MDLDYAYSRIVAALNNVADGGELDDLYPLPDYGRKDRIGVALNEGGKFGSETFHDDSWDCVEAAFLRRGIKPPSRRIDECCRDLLQTMSPST